MKTLRQTVFLSDPRSYRLYAYRQETVCDGVAAARPTATMQRRIGHHGGLPLSVFHLCLADKLRRNTEPATLSLFCQFYLSPHGCGRRLRAVVSVDRAAISIRRGTGTARLTSGKERLNIPRTSAMQYAF